MRNLNARSLFSAATGIASAVLARRSRRAGRRLAPQQGMFSIQTQSLEDRSLMTDIGGNSIAQATNLGTDTDQYFSDYAGVDDRNDYYRFTISQRSSVRIDLTNLIADIDERLMNANQSILASSTRGDSNSKLINVTLDAGTYYIHVYPWGSASSRYTMSLDITALVPPDRAGNTFGDARNIGTINSATTFSDFVSASGDSLDYYPFNVSQTSNVSMLLNGLSANADMYLYDSQGNWITGSWNSGTQSESISRQLNAGTYTVLVYGNTGETNYDLRFQADAVTVTNPPDRVNVQTQPLNSSSVRLTWNDASNEHGYRIFSWNGTSTVQIGSTNQNETSFTATGLEAGQRHWFYVQSHNGAGSTNSFWVYADTPAGNWDNDPQVVSTRTQLRNLSSYSASIYRQLDAVPIQNWTSDRTADNYARAIEQFNVQDTSRSTNISNRYTRGGYSNWDTRCNIFAGDVMRAMNAPLPRKSSSDPMFRNANGINNWLNSQDGRNAGWTRIDVSTSAGMQQLLNHVRAGRPALASLNSSVNTVSGHIAVIRPDQPGSVSSLADVRIAQAGARNFANNTVNYGFGSAYGVEVFIHA